MRSVKENAVKAAALQDTSRPFFSKEIERGLMMIANHAGRVAIYYDIASTLVRVCKPGEAVSDWQPGSSLFTMEDITQESHERIEQVLRTLQMGGTDGEVKLQVHGPGAEGRWLNLRYSFTDTAHGQAPGAIISYQDISEHHRFEMAYLRQKQALEQDKTHIGQLEVDLDTDTIEQQSGKMAPPGASAVGQSLTSFGRRMVELKMSKEDWEEGIQFFSPAFLLDQYAKGNYALSRVWKMQFYGGRSGWVRVEAELVYEPYIGHIKAFIKLTDITVEQEVQMLVNLRAEKDGLTGLLNRATLESRVKECMQQDDEPGILLLMDMDDLKKINDTYGHIEGDSAIRSVAQTMRTHFRQTDLLGRLGGDEFLVFLRGAAKDPEAIAGSLALFLERLSTVCIGINCQQSLRCSIGCAIQMSQTDEFETLYQQADTALYHVKREAKNGFAFYDEEMERLDYRLQADKQLAITTHANEQVPQGQRLLHALLDYYQLVLSMNLTANSYFLAAEVSGGVFSRLPVSGSFEDFVDLALKGVHPQDRSEFRKLLSRECLIEAYHSGKRDVRHCFRFISENEYRSAEATVLLYVNEVGDVCDFTLLRWE